MIYFKLNAIDLKGSTGPTGQNNGAVSSVLNLVSKIYKIQVDNERLAVTRTSSSIHKHGLTSTSSGNKLVAGFPVFRFPPFGVT